MARMGAGPAAARAGNSGIDGGSGWKPSDGAVVEAIGVPIMPSANPVQFFPSAQPVAMKMNKNWDNPANRQQEIDDALKANHLDSHGWPVRYYPNMALGTDSYGNPNQDPGRTTSRVGVQIGPNAFTGSYGNFLSTLEHEVGAHTGQLANKTFSGPGPGNFMNEVEAYDRELQYAKDHGLTGEEIGGIRGNRNYYFNQLDAEDQARINRGIYTPHK